MLTDAARSEIFVRATLTRLGILCDRASSLSQAADLLRRKTYSAAIVDLHWRPNEVHVLATWACAHLSRRGIRTIITEDTPLAKQIDFSFRLRSAVFLGRAFGSADLLEAIKGSPAQALQAC